MAGIELVAKERLEVTDDVSIIEALGKPVKITKGEYTNIKVGAFLRCIKPITFNSDALSSDDQLSLPGR